MNQTQTVGDHFNINQSARFVGIHPVAEALRRASQSGSIPDLDSRFYQFCVANIKATNNKISINKWAQHEANLIERCRLLEPMIKDEE